MLHGCVRFNRKLFSRELANIFGVSVLPVTQTKIPDSQKRAQRVENVNRWLLLRNLISRSQGALVALENDIGPLKSFIILLVDSALLVGREWA